MNYTTLIFTLTALHTAGASTVIRVIDYPKDGVQLGQGWDSIHANKKQTVGILFEAGNAAMGQVKSMNIVQAEDRSSLMRAMDISIDMQYKGLSFEASAKFDFASSVKVDSQSQTFVARATVENGRDYVSPVNNVAFSVSQRSNSGQAVTLTDPALDLAKKNIDEFHRIYGDSFVSAIHTGAELVSSMTFDVQEKDESQKISAAMSGSGWGFEGSASFESTLESYSKQSKLTLSYYQAGGSGDSIPTDVGGFKSKIGELAALAEKAPHPYAVTLQRFDSLPNWPQRSLPKRSSGQEQLTRLYFEYTTLYDEVGAIEDDPEQYVLGRGVDLEDLAAIKDTLKRELSNLEDVFFDFNNGKLEELPSIESFTSGYELRSRLPLPASYVKRSDYDFVDGDEISKLVSEYWIENIVDRRCEQLGFSDASCLSSGDIEQYADHIPRNYPVIVGAGTWASSSNSASPWKKQVDWGKKTSIEIDRVVTMRAWSKTYGGNSQQVMDIFVEYAEHPGLIRGIRQYASDKTSTDRFVMQSEWGYFDGFEEVVVADYRCWSTTYGEGHCVLKLYLDSTAVFDNIKGFLMETSTLNGAATRTTKRSWGKQYGQSKEQVAHFRTWDDRHGGRAQGYLSVFVDDSDSWPSSQPSTKPSSQASDQPSGYSRSVSALPTITVSPSSRSVPSKPFEEKTEQVIAGNKGETANNSSNLSGCSFTMCTTLLMGIISAWLVF